MVKTGEEKKPKLSPENVNWSKIGENL